MATDSRLGQLIAEPLRAVFDSNIYVAAYLSKNFRSPNKELFRRWRNSEFVLLVSQAILEEVIEKFDQRGIDQALTIELISFVLADAEHVATSADEIPAILMTIRSLPVQSQGKRTIWSPMTPISIVLEASIRGFAFWMGCTFCTSSGVIRNHPCNWLIVITVDPARFGATREDIRQALEAEGRR